MTRVAVVFLAAATLVGAAQPRTVTLRGRVVVAGSGDAIRNARVGLSAAAGTTAPTVLSDGEGRFAIPDVPPSPVVLTAAKPGFAKTSVKIQTVVTDSVVVAMARGAAISGLVVDEAGESIPGASVMVERAGDNSAGEERRSVALTDDTGRYRIGGLAEGRVLVSVFATARTIIMMPGGAGTISSGPGDSQRRIYYPGGSTSDAGEPLALTPGEEKLAIDFVVPANVAVGRRVGAPPGDTTVIAGRILSVDGRPIGGADVMTFATATVGSPRTRQTVTDADGAYQLTFPGDVGGTFRLAVRRPGFLPVGYGQGPPADWPEPVVVAPGQTVNCDLAMHRPGVVSGRLFDENGDPVEGAAVRVLRLAFSEGRRRMVPVATGAIFNARSDDLGRYRVPGLTPGTYYLSAAIGQILVTDSTVDVPGYAPTFYPGTPNAAEGQTITVGRSQEVTGVDFSLARTPTARVAGRAVEANGEPITGGISLSPSRRSGALVESQFGARIERDGRFEFLNVPPGEYVLQASRHRNGTWSEGESASQFVIVDGADVTGIELRTTPGSTIRGHVVADDGTPVRADTIDFSPIAVDTDLASTIGGGAARALVNKDLTFELAGLHGPRLLRITRLPPGWGLKAILHNGSDITDAVLPFGRDNQSLAEVEVVLTRRVSEVVGTVVDSHDRPAATATVVAFSADRSLWYYATRFIGTIDAQQDGTFTIRGLPPGDYYLAVLDRRLTADVFGGVRDPHFLETLVAGSQRATVDEGQRVAVSLRLADR